MRMFALLVTTLFCLTLGISRADAQSVHIAPQSALDAAVQQHVGAADTDRESVLRLLDRAEVKEIASQAGLDLRHVASAARTLEGRQLSDVAGHARQAEQALAGGQSRITISTTMIIIGLLVLILLIVALN